ncbi:MAG TPA: hypothetical protein VNE40_02630 [Candidatus Dormibacteraeota bacterium]|nr:hypothetical protein [Candidatus Dormibacteraeota bacterium]
MGKLLLFLSFVIIVFLSVGAVLYPQNPIFLLASTNSIYQHVRELLAFVLILQLVTRPPRHVWIRVLSGTIALSAIIWTIDATYVGQMLPLDILAFLGASIAIGVTAIERRIITPTTWLAGNKVLT